MRCRMRSIRQDYSCFDAIFDGYTSSTALAVPLPLKGKALELFCCKNKISHTKNSLVGRCLGAAAKYQT